jgi:hypothetical protein
VTRGDWTPRRAAAAVLLTAVVPVYVDVSLHPGARKSLGRHWVDGALEFTAALSLAAGLDWAVEQFPAKRREL